MRLETTAARTVIAALLTLAQAESPRSLEPRRDVTDGGFAFVEVAVDRSACFVQAPLRIVLRFGVERQFLLEKMVQPFGTKLEVPVQLSAAWLDGLPAASLLRVDPPPVAGSEPALPHFAQNESVQRAFPEPDRVVDGRSFLVCRKEVVLLPTAIGSLEIPAPVLSFAYATRFEDRFLEGRAPLDRIDAFVTGKPSTVEVRPLPEEGRPPEFTGAVGTFSVHAVAAPTVVALGESLKLSLVVQGEGNLALFDAPRWSEIGGFRVLGMVDEKTAKERTMTYDLAPVSSKVWQVPSIPFASFDPSGSGGYRVERTQPIEVTVRARAEQMGIPAERESVSPAWPSWIVLPSLGLLGLLLLALWLRRRR